MRKAPLRKILRSYERRSCLVYRQDVTTYMLGRIHRDVNIIRELVGMDK